MQGGHPPKRSFDDRAALEELERLQGSIREYRRQRERAEGEFDAFVESFRTAAEPPARVQPSTPVVYSPPVGSASAPAEPVGLIADPPSPADPAPAPAAHAAVPRTAVVDGATAAAGSAPPVPAESRSAVTPPDSSEWALPERAPSRRVPIDRFPTVAPVAAGKFDLFADEPGSTRAEDIALPPDFFGSTPAPTRSRLPLILAVATLLLVAAVVVSRYRPVAAPGLTSDVAAPAESSPAASPADSRAAAPSTGASAAVSPDGSAATPAPPSGAASPAPAGALPSAAPFAEIRTLRHAWVRVIIDGRREIERELPADSRIPLPAGTTFVVRAGDAGAVHFFLNGQDQGPLGAEAQVVTRTFTVAAR